MRNRNDGKQVGKLALRGLMAVRSDRAFTLAELLLVLAILGMLILLAAPALNSIGRSRSLEIAARTLAMDIRTMQQKAITTGRGQRIEFRLYNNDYLIRDIVTEERYRVRLPEGVNYHSVNFNPFFGHPSFTFRHTGNPSMGGTVELIDSEGNIMAVIVTVATGRVRVAEK